MRVEGGSINIFLYKNKIEGHWVDGNYKIYIKNWDIRKKILVVEITFQKLNINISLW